MASEATKIGVVGCGAISGIYLKTAKFLEAIEPVAVCDLDTSRAKARAEEFGIPRVVMLEEMLADEGIGIVLNLTVPAAHYEVALRALEAGKSVYNEKPLAAERDEGRRLLETARAKGVRVGGAPDTFLGAGLQTCRRLLDNGAIGEPVAAAAFLAGHGHESWHPNPEFYYKKGGGPMFDMGPYYVTALVSLLGPVRRVTGSTRASFAERTITSEPKHGQTIRVEVPTHVAGILDFASGAVATLLTSFDVWKHNLPRIEIYGTEASLSVPDPNGFGGPVAVGKDRREPWEEMPLTHPYASNSRGLGVADLAAAMRSGRPHRASAELTFHVLDVMHAVYEASDSGRHVAVGSTCERPAPMPENLAEGQIDP